MQQHCWADPPARPQMDGVVTALNHLVIDLMGQDRAIAAFPDVAKLVLAQRRAAAAAAGAAGGDRRR